MSSLQNNPTEAKKSIYTLASNIYQESIRLNKFKTDKITFFDYIKNENSVTPVKQNEKSFSKTKFNMFIKRNEDLIQKRIKSKENHENHIKKESFKSNSLMKSLTKTMKNDYASSSSLDDFYNNQLKYEKNKQLKIKEIAHNQSMKYYQECRFIPKIDKKSDEIIKATRQIKSISNEKHSFFNEKKEENKETKSNLVFDRLFFQSNERRFKNTLLDNENHEKIRKTTTKDDYFHLSKKLFIRKVEDYKKFEFDENKKSILLEKGNESKNKSNQHGRLNEKNELILLERIVYEYIKVVKEIILQYDYDYNSSHDYMKELRNKDIQLILIEMGYLYKVNEDDGKNKYYIDIINSIINITKSEDKKELDLFTYSISILLHIILILSNNNLYNQYIDYIETEDNHHDAGNSYSNNDYIYKIVKKSLNKHIDLNIYEYLNMFIINFKRNNLKDMIKPLYELNINRFIFIKRHIKKNKTVYKSEIDLCSSLSKEKSRSNNKENNMLFNINAKSYRNEERKKKKIEEISKMIHDKENEECCFKPDLRVTNEYYKLYKGKNQYQSKLLTKNNIYLLISKFILQLSNTSL